MPEPADELAEARQLAIDAHWRLLGYMNAADPGGDWDISDPFLKAPPWLVDGVRALTALEWKPPDA